MKDSELQIDRSCHVLYSKPCKKEILAKITLHYPEVEREAVWEQVQLRYEELLSKWRTDLGGKKNFHNGVGGTYDCIAIMCFYDVCRDVVTFREMEEIEENLILPSFRKLRFVDINKPFWKKLMYRAFALPKSTATNGTITRWMLRLTKTASPFIMNLRRVRRRSLPSGTVLRTLCPPCAMWTMRPWNCSMPSWCGRPPAWTAADATTPSAAIKTHT